MKSETFEEFVQKVGVVEVAKLVNTHLQGQISYQAVQQWAASGVPAKRVVIVEQATGISRHAIRPDIFGPPDEAA
jgi:DNA-binding transcriptional regulator YdaS (Cro superfamily)